MTRTYITAGDGTLYRAEGMVARNIRRCLRTAFFLLLAIFASAAIIGLQRAAIAPTSAPAPTATKITVIKIADAKKACVKAPKGSMQDCLALYLRHAWSDARTFTPAGPALVKECFSQYRGRELADCLTQEI